MQTENIRISHATNYRLTQYKKKNKLKNKSEAIEQLLANDSLRSHIAEKIIAYIPESITTTAEGYSFRKVKQQLRERFLNEVNEPQSIKD
jgi:hypothetical protein